MGTTFSLAAQISRAPHIQLCLTTGFTLVCYMPQLKSAAVGCISNFLILYSLLRLRYRTDLRSGQYPLRALDSFLYRDSGE